ncbi:MAG: hypothetical protein ACKOAU_07515 [Pirellula sp.]
MHTQQQQSMGCKPNRVLFVLGELGVVDLVPAFLGVVDYQTEQEANEGWNW